MHWIIKKNIIFNEILNYICNPREYVKFAEKINVEEFMDDTGKSKSSVDNKNTVTCITDSDNKITTDDAELDNKAITGAKNQIIKQLQMLQIWIIIKF